MAIETKFDPPYCILFMAEWKNKILRTVDNQPISGEDTLMMLVSIGNMGKKN